MSRPPSGPSRPQNKHPKSPTTPVSRTRAASPFTSTSNSPSTRLRTKSTPKPPTHLRPSLSSHQDELPTSKPAVSIREAIALKRAEAKKSVSKGGSSGGGLDGFGSLEDALPTQAKKADEDDIVELGRWSVKETLERGRSTGTINISTRSLPCIPSALFEIHLGVTPDPLKSVPKEPPISTGSEPSTAPRRGGRQAPTWFEAQDLQVLKAWSNEIIEIQPEISLFGSLKTLDLHNNKIKSLPDTIADLTALVTLDMSHNALESLPELFFALPSLTTLNLSHNSLTSLPFSSPFSNMSTGSRSSYYGGSFFAPTITRASEPLPRLLTLDVSHNKISAEEIDNALPASVTKMDLSSNPLSNGCRNLMQSLSRLEKLREVRLETAEIDDDAFPVDLFTSSPLPFPRLRLLDLGETKVTADAVKGAFVDVKQELSFDVTTEDPPEGTIRIVIGKKVIREAWELEVERRTTKLRGARSVENFRFGSGPSITEIGQRRPKQEPVKETQNIVTEGAKSATSSSKSASTPKPQPPLKEPWEIEAEEGLLTEGGRRRARAAAAAAAAAQNKPESSTSHSPPTSFSLTRYYDASTQTLTLPPSTAPPKIIGHSRAFSLATSASLSPFEKDRGKSDMTLPTHTLPLSVIVTHPFAQTLRALVLVNRRMDRSLSLPTLPETDGGCLPHLEELNLDGCGFSDTVPVLRAVESGSKADPTQRSNEPFLPLLTQLFPTLQTLDLSYNALTNTALTTETLTSLILSSSTRKGLKHLRLRGNRLSELDGLQGVAELFKGNRFLPEWKLEELDLRDNEIGKLPPELGLLPLDVFLVEGNIFRIPPRRVWEREGTKGLLSWLRGRIE